MRHFLELLEAVEDMRM